MQNPPGNFQDFWPYYLAQHRHPLNRRLHWCGTLGVIGLALTALVTGNAYLLLLCPVSGYSFAWTGHFFVEHNKPATFKAPFLSLIGDFWMFAFMTSGRLDGELKRLSL